jgi:Mg-chelatase subunit ChlD
MEDQDHWKRLRQRMPPWALSLLVHAAILTLFGVITWVVAEVRQPDRLLQLTGEEFVSEEGGEADGLAGLGPGAPGERGGQSTPQSEALLPAVPPTPSLAEPVAESMEPARLTQLLAGAVDPTAPLAGSLSGAAGGGLGRGVGAFGREIGGLRKTGLDVVLVLDATDSMTPYIEQAKKRLQQVVDVVTHLVPDARFGVVAYKDYGDDWPNAVKAMKLTDDRKAVRKFIADVVAGGGGDEPEPIHEALAVAVDAKKIGWLRGRKWVVILVGDSSVHSSGRRPAFDLARRFKSLRGTINVIDVGGTGEQGAQRRSVKPDLAQIAQEGGGSGFLLRDREAFWRHLIVSVFGQRYEQDVGAIIKTLVDRE